MTISWLRTLAQPFVHTAIHTDIYGSAHAPLALDLDTLREGEKDV